MKKTTTRTINLEDLDYQEILSLPEKKKYSLIKKQILKAKTDTMNSIEIVPDGSRHSRLFSSLNLILLHSRTAEREIDQIIKNLK